MSNLNSKNNNGFVLLFAVLVSVLVLAVGASIISIALKQVILSGAGRESQYAFYAANTGIECALYWDLADENAFINNSEETYSGSGITCAGINISDQISVSLEDGVDYAIHKFTLDFADLPGVGSDDEDQVAYCVDVTVTKEIDRDFDFDRVKTTVLSRGYNTCDEENPRRIERGLELIY